MRARRTSDARLGHDKGLGMNRFALLLAFLLSAASAERALAQKIEVITPLAPTAQGFAGSFGEAEYEVKRNRTEFEVEIEEVPPGEYWLYVNGLVRTGIVVDDDEGEVVFSTRPRRNQIELDFDPNGALIEITLNDEVVLSGLARRVDEAAPERTFPRQNVRERMSNLDGEQSSRASATVQLRSNRKRAELRINARRLVTDSYTLMIDGQSVATVFASRGRINERFSTRPRGRDRMMNFDPSSARVELVRDGFTAFTTDIAGEDLGTGVRPLGELVRAMANTGEIPAAEGELEYRVTPRAIEFEVEIEDVPVGSYGVSIDGFRVGTIEAQRDPEDNEVEGEIEFSTAPDDPDETLLFFDVLGRTVQVTDDAGTVILSLTFDGTLVPGDGIDDDDLDDDDDDDDLDDD